jgi:hypothetical protein
MALVTTDKTSLDFWHCLRLCYLRIYIINEPLKGKNNLSNIMNNKDMNLDKVIILTKHGESKTIEDN